MKEEGMAYIPTVSTVPNTEFHEEKPKIKVKCRQQASNMRWAAQQISICLRLIIWGSLRRTGCGCDFNFGRVLIKNLNQN